MRIIFCGVSLVSLVLALLATRTICDAFRFSFAPNPAKLTRTKAGESLRTTTRTTTFLAASNANELFPLKRGSTVALVTPFDKDTGAVNYGELRKLLQRQVNNGIDNLCILGTTGESNVLTKEERTKVLTIAVEEAKGRMTILAGTGSINPHHVKEMTLEAKDLGCDAALVVTPYYVKPPQRYLVQHFVNIADQGGLPVIIYNVPGRTGVNMQDTYIALAAQHEQIVGVKDATGDLARLSNLRQELQKSNVKDFLCYSGDDSTTMEFLLQGGDGCISVTANVAPLQMSQMVRAALAGDRTQAAPLNDELMSLHKDLFCESNPIPTKWSLMRMGLISSDHCRPPLGSMDPALVAKVEGALRQAGMI